MSKPRKNPPRPKATVAGAPLTRPTCSVAGCETHVLARGWCQKHYRRWLRTGSPTGMKPQPTRADWQERWGAKVAVRRNGCHEWLGGRVARRGTDLPGYPMFTTPEGGRMNAQRFIYQVTFRPLHPQEYLKELCGTLDCVNPHHLAVVNHDTIYGPSYERRKTLAAKGKA